MTRGKDNFGWDHGKSLETVIREQQDLLRRVTACQWHRQGTCGRPASVIVDFPDGVSLLVCAQGEKEIDALEEEARRER